MQRKERQKEKRQRKGYKKNNDTVKERKKAEAEINKLHKAIESSKTAIWLTEPTWAGSLTATPGGLVEAVS